MKRLDISSPYRASPDAGFEIYTTVLADPESQRAFEGRAVVVISEGAFSVRLSPRAAELRKMADMLLSAAGELEDRAKRRSGPAAGGVAP